MGARDQWASADRGDDAISPSSSGWIIQCSASCPQCDCDREGGHGVLGAGLYSSCGRALALSTVPHQLLGRGLLAHVFSNGSPGGCALAWEGVEVVTRPLGAAPPHPRTRLRLLSPQGHGVVAGDGLCRPTHARPHLVG